MSLDLSGLTHQRGRQGGVPEVANSEFLERPGQSAASARKPQRPAASARRVSAHPRTSAYTNTERNGVGGMRGTSRKDGTSAYWVQAGHGLERARRRDPGARGASPVIIPALPKTVTWSSSLTARQALVLSIPHVTRSRDPQNILARTFILLS